jgi:ankyrin repeat protein
MSLLDRVYDGSLTRSQLERYLLTNPPSSLNKIRGKIELTPLCAACRGGHLDVVKHLLFFGADPNVPSLYERTPLFWITDPRCTAASVTRCAIIRELVSETNGLQADLDKPCDDDRNTALMNAIVQLKDKAVIEQLVESGASLTVRHYPNQKTAKELAEEHNLTESLISKAERDLAWEKMIELVVSFLLLIFAYVNNKTVNRAVGGFVKRYYDISVKKEDLPKVPDCIPLSSCC